MTPAALFALLDNLDKETGLLLDAPLEELNGVLDRRFTLLASLAQETQGDLPAEVLAPLFQRIQTLMLSTQRAEARLHNVRNEAISELSQNQQDRSVLLHYRASAAVSPLY